MEKSKPGIGLLELKIAIAVGICLCTSLFIPAIQYMAACFAAILSVQDNVSLSFKTGTNRLILTAVAGVIGIIVILLDQRFQNQGLFILMVVIGVILTIWGCKMVGLPMIAARIGAITLIIVVMVADGPARINFAVLRLVGTLYGVAVSLIITGIFSFIQKPEEKGASPLGVRES